MTLQLQPDVLRAGLTLTRLDLRHCRLPDWRQGLAAGLMQLPDLQHLSVYFVYDECGDLTFPTAVLSHLTKLTSLKLEGVDCGSSYSSSARSLQALTRLADLQLGPGLMQAGAVTADTLSGADQLTRLALSVQQFEPRALSGKTQLQHLTFTACCFVPGTGVAQLLSELQHLTQLTHLDLWASCKERSNLGGPSPPPAAYASLTASSKLQHLGIHSSTLPSAAWQYMCPPGRTLPHLRYLDITEVMEADSSSAAPDTTALVSCCPGLQSLLTSMRCSTAQLAPLQQLTGLQRLSVASGIVDDLDGVQTLCQLTGLQELQVWAIRAAEARILQLTQLTRLTDLRLYGGMMGDMHKHLSYCPQGPDSEPVWRQLLRQLLDSKDPEVAQQAAAVLEAAR